MADIVSQLDRMWTLLLLTTKSGSWYAAHGGAAGYWSQAEAVKNSARAELASRPALASQLDRAWTTLLQTTKSGTWYAAHPGAPGSWSTAEAENDQLEAALLATLTATVDAGAYPVLKAVAAQ